MLIRTLSLLAGLFALGACNTTGGGLTSSFGGSSPQSGSEARVQQVSQQTEQQAAPRPQKIAYSGLKKIVAVSRFENRTPFSSGGLQRLPSGMQTQLSDALVASGAFIVLERATLTDVVGEQNLAASNRAATAQSARTGNLVAAQALVKGVITEFQAESEGRDSIFTIGGIALGGGKGETHIGVVIQLIDTTTGQVIASERVEGKATREDDTTGINIGGIGYQSQSGRKDPLGKATQQAIDQAVVFIGRQLANKPFKGRVANITGKDIYISAGARNGAEPGDRFTVLSVGQEIKDPYTGEILGRKERAVGEIEVMSVNEKFSIARAVSSLPVKVGDFVQHKRS